MSAVDNVIYAVCLLGAALALLSVCAWTPQPMCTGSTITTSEGVQCLD